MNIRCGVDIIEISRVKESIENLGNKFLEKIYTPIEIQYCESKGKQKYQHYAARFAAKEAIFKAISQDTDTIQWKEYEVINKKNGKPQINIENKKIKENIENIDISISHCKEYAIANVVVFLKEEGKK